MIKIDFWEIIKNAFPASWGHWPVVVFVLLVILIVIKKVFEKRISGEYQYQSKSSIMTHSESSFFKLLTSIIDKRYNVFPQMHLDTFLYYRIRGQNWTGAFHHINQKSVDFLICDLENEKPLLAIELDDSSHEREDRMDRDEKVEIIFKEVNLPLVRFKNHAKYDQGEIRQRIFEILTPENKLPI